MSAPYPEAEQLPDGNRVGPPVDDLPVYGVACSFRPDTDRSGAFRERHSAGAERLLAAEARALTGSLHVALQVPIEEWQTIWTPFL